MNDEERKYLNLGVREMYKNWEKAGGEFEFYEIAAGHFYGLGMEKQQALLEARKRYPKLYEKYRERIAAGAKDVLPLVFEKYGVQHDEAKAAGSGKLN